MPRNKSKTIRNEKGKNLKYFPDDYVIIDIETTDKNIYNASIIQLGALKVKNNQIVDCYNKLVRPEYKNKNGKYVNAKITKMTGITNESLDKAEDTKTALREYYDFIGDSVVIGHNINAYDVNILYDNFKKYLELLFENDFVDTLTLYKKVNPGAKSHKLKDLCEEYGIKNEHAHNAYYDCKATYSGYLKLRDVVLSNKNIFKSVSNCNKQNGPIRGNKNKINSDSPLYKKGCVFTGTFQKVTRDEEFQIVRNIGGRASKSIGKTSNFLFCDNKTYFDFKNNNLDKQNTPKTLKLALEKIDNGDDMKILSESNFYDMVGDDIDELKSY